MTKTAFCFFVLLLCIPRVAGAMDFDTWLSGFKKEAVQRGISQSTLDAALNNVKPIQKVIDLDRKQPEKKITFSQYKKNVVNDQRIIKGRQMLRAYARELEWVHKTYGVPSQYVLALWAIETNFGENTGGFMVVDSLATLAWEGRRAAFFREELIKALKIIDGGHIPAALMKGSWAGAMGQNQFMPSSFFAFAVDADGDGKADIWNDRLDVFASTANYLSKNGWVDNQSWGHRVKLPENFPSSLATPKIVKPVSFWRSAGVTDLSGAPLKDDTMMSSIVAPDGLKGEAYIVFKNYQTIMSWNRSTYFATSVGLIADAIAR